ncbi:MAG: transporter substrate-binding domain-containing protein [Desulfamplus sp.]|nr:transporter substrate-binding domain-containing protein [Desulfamplus sp.]
MIKNSVNTIYIICFILILNFLMPYQTVNSSDLSDVSSILTPEEKTWISNHPVLKVNGPKAFPPFSFFEDTGDAKGIAYDYLMLIMGQIGIKLEVASPLPWPEVLNKAKAKEIDIISCVAKAPDREEYLSFSDPYLTFPLVIISRRESEFIGGLDDLKGRKVAMVKKNIVYEWLNRDKIAVVSHFEESALDCIKSVSSGKAEAYIDNLASAVYFIEKYGLTNLKVAAPTAYQNYDLHIAVRKDFPELSSIINKLLKRLTSDQHTQIRNRWLSVRYEYGISPDDLKRWGLIIGTPLFIIISLIIFWNRRLKLEIAERKRVENALSESQRRYSEIFETSRDGFVFVDSEGKFIDANQAYCTMLGYTLEELTHKANFYEITPQIWRDWELKEIWEKRLLKEGYSGIYEKEYIRKDGTIFPVELQSYTFFDESGEPYYLWGIVRDITSRNLAEEERERLREQLYQAQKMESIGRLAGGIAHDFNNMLGVILGQTELAMAQIHDVALLKNKLTQIRNATERSMNLTRQLLAYARKQTITPKVVNINELLEGMLKVLRDLMGDNIEIVLLPDHALWLVKIDPTQLDQILTNLCVNARDAISGNGKVTIETENTVCDQEYCDANPGVTAGEYVQLIVSDDGCGMEREYLEKIFEPFFTTKEVGKGTGLGLATVYGIVKQNQGFIKVDSKLDMGTTFRIYFPRCNCSES